MNREQQRYLANIFVNDSIHRVGYRTHWHATVKSRRNRSPPILLIEGRILLHDLRNGHRRGSEDDDFLVGEPILHHTAIPLMLRREGGPLLHVSRICNAAPYPSPFPEERTSLHHTGNQIDALHSLPVRSCWSECAWSNRRSPSFAKSRKTCSSRSR